MEVISGSNATMRVTTVAFIMQGLHQGLMPLLAIIHTGSLKYRHCCKRLNQGKKPFNAQFSMVEDEKNNTLPGNGC